MFRRFWRIGVIRGDVLGRLAGFGMRGRLVRMAGDGFVRLAGFSLMRMMSDHWRVSFGEQSELNHRGTNQHRGANQESHSVQSALVHNSAGAGIVFSVVPSSALRGRLKIGHC
jgi:hypothetical protein